MRRRIARGIVAVVASHVHAEAGSSHGEAGFSSPGFPATGFGRRRGGKAHVEPLPEKTGRIVEAI